MTGRFNMPTSSDSEFFLDRRFFNALDYSRRSAACDEQRILNCYKGIIRKYFIEKSIYPTKGQCGSHTELICHKYNETDALARRNLSLCRCVFAFSGIPAIHAVGCRSPPCQSESQKNSDWSEVDSVSADKKQIWIGGRPRRQKQNHSKGSDKDKGKLPQPTACTAVWGTIAPAESGTGTKPKAVREILLQEICRLYLCQRNRWACKTRLHHTAFSADSAKEQYAEDSCPRFAA